MSNLVAQPRRYRPSHTPNEAREVLSDFVGLADRNPADYGELKRIISLDTRLALADLILQEGHISRDALPTTLRVLDNKQGSSTIRGIVSSNERNIDPVSIKVAKYPRLHRVGHNPTQGVHLRIFDDEPFRLAHEGKRQSYLPNPHISTASLDSLRMLTESEVEALSGEIISGNDLAEREGREASLTLANFLRITAIVVDGLIETQPHPVQETA